MKEIDFKKLNSVLPKYPGVLGREEYFNSAVLIPLVFVNMEYHLLFEKRSTSIRQGGEICFPGGEIDFDNDKSFQETAIRETVEELGISKDNIEKIGSLDTFVGPMGVMVDSIVAKLIVTDLEKINFDKNEVERVFTIPISFFLETQPEVYEMRQELQSFYLNEKGKRIDLLPVKQLGLPERYLKPRQGKKHKVYVFKYDSEIIWGITAALIVEFISKIKKIL
jgi:8-oxo-dGTP pyrophosphatase MutT (NUDIX family)